MKKFSIIYKCKGFQKVLGGKAIDMQVTLVDFSYTIFFIGSFSLSLFITRKFLGKFVSKWKRRNVLMIGTAVFLTLVFILTWVTSAIVADYLLTFYFTAFGVIFFETSRYKVEAQEIQLTQKVDRYLHKAKKGK